MPAAAPQSSWLTYIAPVVLKPAVSRMLVFFLVGAYERPAYEYLMFARHLAGGTEMSGFQVQSTPYIRPLCRAVSSR